MSLCLSLTNCWLPRTVIFQRIFLRSSFSTVSPSDNSSSHRSASRFSLKVARFLFSKDCLNQSAPLSTHAHYTKRDTPADIHELARDFILSLEPDHRQILANELTQVEKLSTNTTAIPILSSQFAVVFLETGLPYIGFGFVDNFVMLVAGETIEAWFGAALCLSTMAAAALGNAVSDVMGIGLADRIERTCGRFLAAFGINPPKLTADQWTQRSIHTTQLLSKIICIFVGCILGMCPLLFRDTSAKKNTSKSKHDD